MKEMFRKIEIDMNIMSISNISLNQLFTLVKIYCDTIHKQFLDYRIDPKDLVKLQELKMIRIVNESNYVLRDMGKRIVETAIGIKITEKAKTNATNNENIEELADKVREKFKGLRTGAMGDRNSLIEKLTRWRINNPSITLEMILEATDRYIESQVNLNYIQRADYFVYKKSGGTEASRLSIYVEELQTPAENSDWASELK